ncbi:MAG: hypothetical protein GC152_12895 [Alphaproteobacteria bacterium]|nr:hypothetical protein [Alphaproteobacteria bacterium]
MVKIVTVHGTNAGAPEDRGEQWWQLGSEFQTKLASKIDDRIIFEPFHWSGANSERERREAGQKLAAKLLTEREPVIVMGHSHGGSVALHALFLLAMKSPKKAFETLRALVTVGTPMIRYSGARNPIFRFNIIGQLFLIYAFMIGGLTTAAILLGDRLGDLSALIGESVFAGMIDFDDNLIGRVAQVFTPAVMTTTVLPFIIMSQFTRRSASRNRAFAGNRLWPDFRGIYAALNHTQDEAIAALKTGVSIDLTIADRRTVQTAIFAPLALVLAGVLAMRTVSEIVDVEAIRTLVAPDLGDEEIIDRSGYATLGIRDAGSQIRALSGEIRTEANDQAGLLRQNVVFLQNDYVVLDLATAARAGGKENLVPYLENLRPTEVSGVVNFNDDRVCSRDAIYLTAAGQARLVEMARALDDAPPATPDRYAPTAVNAAAGAAPSGQSSSPASKIDSPTARRPGRPNFTPVEDIVESDKRMASQSASVARALTAQEQRCRAADVVMLDGTSAIERLIAADALVNLADEALYSHRPELVELSASMKSETAASDDLFGDFLVYPELRRGEAIVFERASFNDAQVGCFFSAITRQAQRFSLGLISEPDRLRSLEGLCAQVEGETFTIYDGATTILSEVEYRLENGVEAIVTLADGLRGVSGEDDYVIEAADYLEAEGVQAGILSPFYFVFSVLIVAFTIAWATSFIFAPMLSSVFNQLIRQNIFGNDGHGEKVEQVAPGLNFAADQVGTLPENVERDIDNFVRQFTSETIERLRDLISLNSIKPKGVNFLPEIGQALTWKELIHTAYFDVDSFIDHTADTLVETAGLTRKVQR